MAGLNATSGPYPNYPFSSSFSPPLSTSSSNHSDPNNDSQDSSNSTLYCGHEPVTEARFAIVVVIGTPIAIFGIFTNLSLIRLFLQKKYRNSPTMYLLILALLDFIICNTYIFLFTIDAVGLYYSIWSLWWLWHQYVMALLTLSRITQMTSTCMVLCATFERFFIVYEVRSMKALYGPQGRRIVVVAVLLVCIALRSPTYWEWKIVKVDYCKKPFEDLQFEPGIYTSEFYSLYYSVYFLQAIQVFLPFLLLSGLNFAIVMRMRSRMNRFDDAELVEQSLDQQEYAGTYLTVLHNIDHQRHQPNGNSYVDPVQIRPRSVSESVRLRRRAQKRKVKTATYTLVAIVTMYLICNSLHTLIKFMELTAKKYLKNDKGESYAFYTISTDVISFLFLSNSFLRFFIYMAFNGELREDMRRGFCFRNNLGYNPRMDRLVQSNGNRTAANGRTPDRPSIPSSLNTSPPTYSPQSPRMYTAKTDLSTPDSIPLTNSLRTNYNTNYNTDYTKMVPNGVATKLDLSDETDALFNGSIERGELKISVYRV